MAGTDWKSIVGSVAPTIATALGGPLAGMAVSAVSKAVLGNPDATEVEVKEAISKSSDPEVLLKLKQAEQEFAAKMKELDINLERIASEDRASARQREMAVRDKTPTVLAYAYTIGYFAILGVIMKWGVPDNAREMINILIGILSAAEVGIITYYFGSSAGSAKKSAAMEEMLRR
ncbi:MAG: hypothetical protein HZA00_10775 [Nitrospinae bacterium]|nr:hypothetical protein [Nitrospinota bacterium]